MQLGFVSAILPDLSLFEVLQQAAQLGYQCVEVMCWPPSKAERRYAGVTHVDAAQPLETLQAAVTAATSQTGVALSGLGYYPNCLAADRGEAEAAAFHLQRLIRLAPQLGLQRVNTFIGRNPLLSVDENWPRLLEVWRPLVRLAEDHGVQIGIENCPMYFTRDEWPGGKNIATSPAIWRRLFSDIPSPHLGLNYDPSHLVWQQMDYLLPLSEFADRLFHIHLKDAELHRERLNQVGILAHPLEYHSPRLPGRGEIDWGRFIAALEASGYSGPLCVEVEDRDFENSLPARLQALALSLQHLQPLLDKSPA
ncbi:MAG: sugar phosphate isomerase/epimerase family protein [Planctomycetota bacterium]